MTDSDQDNGTWVLTDSFGTVLESFDSEDEAREAGLTGEYPDDAEIAYIND